VKLPEPFVYFVDRSLGRGIVVQTLRAAGHEVHAHDDHFAQSTPDTEWLGEVGRRRWVVLTKDKNIRSNHLELRALLDAEVACVMLGHGNLTAEAMGRLFAQNLRRIERILRRFHAPLVASLATSGGLRVLIAAGEWLDPPKEIK
jgi:predicted nuclease of predicted toxin-antitoxin system